MLTGGTMTDATQVFIPRCYQLAAFRLRLGASLTLAWEPYGNTRLVLASLIIVHPPRCSQEGAMRYSSLTSFRGCYSRFGTFSVSHCTVLGFAVLAKPSSAETMLPCMASNRLDRRNFALQDFCPLWRKRQCPRQTQLRRTGALACALSLRNPCTLFKITA